MYSVSATAERKAAANASARASLGHRISTGVAASDSHSVIEVGVTYNILTGDPATPAGLLAALTTVDFVPGRATFYVRAWTPIAKIIQSMKGNGRRRAQPNGGEIR